MVALILTVTPLFFVFLELVHLHLLLPFSHDGDQVVQYTHQALHNKVGDKDGTLINVDSLL